MNKTRLLVVPVVIAFSLVLASAASATTYCVHQPAGCVGTTAASLNTALGWADVNGPGTRDRIEIGAGTFQDLPAVIDAGNPVDVVGAGAGSTILTAAGKNVIAMNVVDPSSTIAQLQVQVVSTGLEVGVRLAGTADHIAVTSSGTQDAIDALQFDGTAGMLRNSTIDVAYTPNQVARGVAGNSAGTSGTIEGSSISASIGIEAANTEVEVRRSRIRGQQAVVAGTGGYVHLADSSVRTPGRYPASQNEYALSTAGGGGPVVVGDRITVYGDGAPNSLGVDMSPDDVAGNHAYVTLENSVLHNFEKDAFCQGGVNAVSTLTTKYSAYRFGKALISFGAVHNATNDLDLTGLDVGFAGGDSGAPVLQYDSPLVDAGDPAYQLPGTIDLFSHERLRDGDGVAGARLDMGAFEYQHVAPVVKAAAAPDPVDPGAPVSFSGTATDPDRGDVLAYEWAFDDGSTASGTDVQHAFASPGAHTGTLTVTDSTGLSTAAAIGVTVNPAPPAPESTPTPPDVVTPPVVAERIAPRLVGLRLSRTTFRARGARSRQASRTIRVGTTARFTTSEPALVTLTVQRRRNGRWVSIGKLARRGVTGRSSIRFDGRLHGRPMAPGRYRIRAVARDADGMTSTPATVRFRIAGQA